MLIRLKKRDHKKHTLSCVRDDGSVTWCPDDDYFAHHDLIHYVVETTLGYRQAFYGLLAAGWEVSDFGQLDPATGKKRVIPLEAGHTEMIASALQAELWGGIPPESFFEMLEMACANMNVPPSAITPEQLAAMRERIPDLFGQWRALPVGETLELVFDVAGPMSAIR